MDESKRRRTYPWHGAVEAVRKAAKRLGYPSSKPVPEAPSSDDKSRSRLEQYERLRDAADQARTALRSGERAPDELVIQYIQIVHNHFVGRHPGVRSYCNTVELDASLPVTARGAFSLQHRKTQFSHEISDALRRLFGRSPLGGDDLSRAKNALRCVLHEAGHALSKASIAAMQRDDRLYSQDRWMAALEEGVVESFARRHIDNLVQSLTLDKEHPGLQAAQIPPRLLPYPRYTALVDDLAAWMAHRCRLDAGAFIDKLCLYSTNENRARTIADTILNGHPDLTALRMSGKIGENAEKDFRRKVESVLRHNDMFGSISPGLPTTPVSDLFDGIIQDVVRTHGDKNDTNN